MYKSVYVPETVLAYPLLYGSALLKVPVLLYSRLSSILAPGDWTYLRISQSCRTEIVKVVGLIWPDTCVVVRHQDGTDEETFSEGAIVDYTATIAEVLDSYHVDPLQLLGDGAIQVDGTHVTYTPFTIQLEGPLQLIGGDSIGRVEGAYGARMERAVAG